MANEFDEFLKSVGARPLAEPEDKPMDSVQDKPRQKYKPEPEISDSLSLKEVLAEMDKRYGVAGGEK